MVASLERQFARLCHCRRIGMTAVRLPPQWLFERHCHCRSIGMTAVRLPPQWLFERHCHCRRIGMTAVCLPPQWLFERHCHCRRIGVGVTAVRLPPQWLSSAVREAQPLSPRRGWRDSRVGAQPCTAALLQLMGAAS